MALYINVQISWLAVSIFPLIIMYMNKHNTDNSDGTIFLHMYKFIKDVIKLTRALILIIFILINDMS